MQLQTIDYHLTNLREQPGLSGISRVFAEFLYFGLKQARACLFASLFFAAVFLAPRAGLWHMPRYDILLAIAIAIQIWMVWSSKQSTNSKPSACFT